MSDTAEFSPSHEDAHRPPSSELRDRRHDERGTFAEHAYVGAAGNRDYKLYVPTGYDGEPRGLVVMLHGCTQSVDDFAGGTNMNDVANESGLLVVYPIQSASANKTKCWNWFEPRNQRRDEGEPAIIVGIVRQIAARYAVDPQRIYAAGLSAGGAAAAVLGARYPDVFAAIGIHSGLACGAAHDVFSAFAAMRGRDVATVNGRADDGRTRVPTIVFHGDGDRTVNPANADRIVAATQASAAKSTTQTGAVPGGKAFTRTVYHDETGSAMVERWTIHGTGHAWSGGVQAHSYVDSAGPNASRAMIRFFLAHQLVNAASSVCR